MRKSYLWIVLGILNFVYPLIKWINSFAYNSESGKISSSGDYMVWTLTGIFIILIGIYQYFEEKESNKLDK